LGNNPALLDYKSKNRNDAEVPLAADQCEEPENLDRSQAGRVLDRNQLGHLADYNQRVQNPEPKLLFLAPYVPKLSESLKRIASRYELNTWFSFSGRISDGLISFKDHVPVSKSRYSIYNAACICGMRYIGESDRNLKLRIIEHKGASSNSSFSAHLRIRGGAHALDANKTEVVAHEKNLF
ncbi:MAG: hypothetical protein GY861_00460, partial [bacterium]|nr:hypothetical protein [bacterium]